MAKRIYRAFVPALALILLLSGCGVYGPQPEAVWDGAGQEAWDTAGWEALRGEPESAGRDLPWEELDDADWEALWAVWESTDWEALLKTWENTWESTWNDEYPEGAKDHYYQVLSGDGSLLHTVSSGEALDRLDDLLYGGDIWEVSAQTQEPGAPACTYVCYMERTLLAGETQDAGQAYHEIIRFTVAKDRDTVTVRILSELGGVELLPWLNLEDLLTFSVSVSTETAEALRNPDQFTD